MGLRNVAAARRMARASNLLVGGSHASPKNTIRKVPSSPIPTGSPTARRPLVSLSCKQMIIDARPKARVCATSAAPVVNGKRDRYELDLFAVCNRFGSGGNAVVKIV